MRHITARKRLPAYQPLTARIREPHEGVVTNLSNDTQQPANGLAIAGLVLGVTSIVFCWAGLLALAQIVLAIVFSSVGIGNARRGAGRRGMAVGGLACGVVGGIAYFVIGVTSAGVGFVILGVGQMIIHHVTAESLGSATLPGISLLAFKATLEEYLDRTIQVLPMRLPPGLAGCWTGRFRADRIGYDPQIPALTLEVVTHAAGHLALEHGGVAQGSGRFACSLSRHPFPGPGFRHGFNRAFSDTEEHMAGHFASVMLRLFGVTPIQSARRPMFTCIDLTYPRRSS
jgi:hypothetical protein